MSLVGWNESEIMYSRGNIDTRPNTIAMTNRDFFHERIPKRPGVEGALARRGAAPRRLVSLRASLKVKVLTLNTASA
jgi:hypothetical protein